MVGVQCPLLLQITLCSKAVVGCTQENVICSRSFVNIVNIVAEVLSILWTLVSLVVIGVWSFVVQWQSWIQLDGGCGLRCNLAVVSLVAEFCNTILMVVGGVTTFLT